MQHHVHARLVNVDIVIVEVACTAYFMFFFHCLCAVGAGARAVSPWAGAGRADDRAAGSDRALQKRLVQHSEYSDTRYSLLVSCLVQSDATQQDITEYHSCDKPL